MTLSERDCAILSAYQTHGEESIRRTAALTGIKSHIVRRTIVKATKERALHRRVFTNIFDLGLQQCTLILSCDTKSQEQRQRVEAILRTAPNVELVLEIDSTEDHQLYVLLAIRDTSALENFFQYVTTKSGIDVRVVRTHTRSGWYFFGTKSLHPNYIPTPIHITHTHTQTHERIDLSSEDFRVLEVFASSPNGIRTHMARTLAMPLMTFQYRIEKLERLGIIKGVRYQILADALGYKQFRCFITANLPLETTRNQLYEWAKKHPHIIAMMYGVGSWHYELRIEAPDQIAAERLVGELVSTFAHFIHYSDLVPIRTLVKLAPHLNYTIFEASVGNGGSPPSQVAG
jgi:DNA-binding Lrp family transcriptional regulator